eukprot:CAMPEP_0172922162 /NCGR_PEP_ID=MMETSP1075-20121228/207301_1 /TAXON_ID=2916 /ORGANISM="Ceratium fusus, Strain PA161109" /LENGTH=145 /DNA_ID=CAMNT_0013782441 /DNA_START=27 /DNA_END=462 /DNA_ORIENTATION=-
MRQGNLWNTYCWVASRAAGEDDAKCALTNHLMQRILIQEATVPKLLVLWNILPSSDASEGLEGSPLLLFLLLARSSALYEAKLAWCEESTDEVRKRDSPLQQPLSHPSPCGQQTTRRSIGRGPQCAAFVASDATCWEDMSDGRAR